MLMNLSLLLQHGHHRLDIAQRIHLTAAQGRDGRCRGSNGNELNIAGRWPARADHAAMLGRRPGGRDADALPFKSASDR